MNRVFEPTMTRLRATEVFSDSKVRLVAIESIDLVCGNGNPIGHVSARIEPIALIVCDSDRIEALDLRAESIDLARLRRELPELDSMIEM